MKNTVIYLFGYPGTGKYTIAREIAARSGARLIDNHLINNPILALMRVDGKTKIPKQAWDYTRRILDAVLDAIINLADKEQSFIFTNFLVEDEPGSVSLYAKIKQAAEDKEALFIPVRLTIDLPELQRRIVSEDRNQRMKMTDAEQIAIDYQAKTLFNTDHKHKLELDVTGLPPGEAAEAILGHVEKCRRA